MKYVLFEDRTGTDRAVIFVETQSRVNTLAVVSITKSPGADVWGFDFGDNENVSCVNGSITLGQSFSTEQSDDDTMTLRLIERTRV